MQPERWYLLRNGVIGGPYEETVIVRWIRNGLTDATVRSAMSTMNASWSPLTTHPSFANALATARSRRAAPARALTRAQVLSRFTLGFVVIFLFDRLVRQPSHDADRDFAVAPVLSEVDTTCAPMTERVVDLTRRGILSDHELDKPPQPPPHVSAVQLRRTGTEFMAQCRTFEPEIRTCMKSAKTLMDYELCARTDGELSRDH